MAVWQQLAGGCVGEWLLVGQSCIGAPLCSSKCSLRSGRACLLHAGGRSPYVFFFSQCSLDQEPSPSSLFRTSDALRTPLGIIRHDALCCGRLHGSSCGAYAEMHIQSPTPVLQFQRLVPSASVHLRPKRWLTNRSIIIEVK